MRINSALLLLVTVLCNKSFATCVNFLSEEDKGILKATELKMIKSEKPDYPLSFAATKLASELLKNSNEDTVEVGCVALKFKISGKGKSQDIKILISNPKNIFDRSAILAIKKYEFAQKSDIGVHIIHYKVSR